MSLASGGPRLILSILWVLVGVFFIINGITKGKPGVNTEIAIGSVAIVYGIARYWFFKSRYQ